VNTSVPTHRAIDACISVVQENRLLRQLRAVRSGLRPGPVLVPVAIEVGADVEFQAIAAALRSVAARHDVLRSEYTFPDAGEEIRATVAPDVVPDLVETSMGTITAEERITAAADVQNGLLAEPRALTRAPLWHGRVLRFDGHATLVVLAVEHMIFDGHSRTILVQDFARELDRVRTGEPERDRPRQYAEWTAWQREMLAGPEGDDLVDFWRDHLAGTVPFPPLDAPDGDPESPVEWAAVRLPVSACRRDAVYAAARERGLTPYAANLAIVVRAWRDLTGAADVVVHTPCANRTTDLSLEVIGWLAHSIPIRFHDLPQTAGDFLAEIRTLVMEGMASQDMPLPMLTRMFQPDSHGRARRRQRLYYAYHPRERYEWALASGGWVRLVDLPEQEPISESDLSLIVRESEEETTFSIEFNPKEIARTFVDDLAASLSTAMNQLFPQSRD
jgi:hypothetical protein